jgi:hypothetical protein
MPTGECNKIKELATDCFEHALIFVQGAQSFVQATGNHQVF